MTARLPSRFETAKRVRVASAMGAVEMSSLAGGPWTRTADRLTSCAPCVAERSQGAQIWPIASGGPFNPLNTLAGSVTARALLVSDGPTRQPPQTAFRADTYPVGPPVA